MLRTITLSIAAAALSAGLIGSASALPITSPVAANIPAVADATTPGGEVTKVRDRRDRWRHRGGDRWRYRGHRGHRDYRHRHRGHSYFNFSFGVPSYNYYAPQPHYYSYRPAVVVPVIPHAYYQPWSADWYAYCRSKYRSFDPRTGYYTTYSGYKRLCQ